MIASRMTPAISVRAAISVTGGMVATPILISVKAAPHSVASASNNTRLIAVRGCGVSIASVMMRSVPFEGQSCFFTSPRVRGEVKIERSEIFG